MIGVAMFTTIKTLWEKHRNNSAIAELTGHDWKTVSKVVKLIESGAGYPLEEAASDTEYQEIYQAKMAGIGPYAEHIFFIALERQHEDWTRTVQGILSLAKSYPKDIVNLACKRAVAFGVHNYQIIKRICLNGSYNLPVEFNHEEIKRGILNCRGYITPLRTGSLTPMRNPSRT